MGQNEGGVADPYARITGRILEQLEQGVRPWTKPWSANQLGGRVTRPLRSTGEAYQGINVLLLWMEAIAASRVSSIWMTYRQALALGGQVRRGERGCPVVYFGKLAADSADAGTAQSGAEEDAREVRFLKTYTVFNVEQIDGLPERFMLGAAEPPPLPAPSRLGHADRFLGALGIEVRHGGSQAYYSAAEDRIQLPPLEAFHDAEGYYTTWAHEAVHATRHPSRLDRDFGKRRFGGSENYAREELVAELGSAFLAADLGLALEPREDHAAYLESWIKVLQGDKRAIVSAAAHAERAVRFLHELQETPQTVL